MSGRRPAVYKNHPIVEDATRAGEPDSTGRLPQRRDVTPAVIGVLDCTPWVRQQNNGQWVDH